MQRKDLWIAPACEAGLLLVVGLAGCLTRQPMLFTSLGPTAYELIETPQRRSARPYSIVMGHLTAIGAGYLAVWASGAWSAPIVSSSGVPMPRVWATVLAAAVTVFATLLLRASQPAALSTTLLIALGSMQKPKDAAVIMGAVVLLVLIGEPLRSWRLRTQEKAGDQGES